MPGAADYAGAPRLLIRPTIHPTTSPHAPRFRPRIPGDPRADRHPGSGARRHAAAGGRHLFGSAGRADQLAARRPFENLRHRRALLHLHRQRPRRLGSGAHQCADARRQGAGAGKRPLRARLGRVCAACSAPRWRSCPAIRAARSIRPAVAARLKADRAGAIKAILVVQVDTASGVVNDIAAIGQAVRAAGHDALLMVDTVASLALHAVPDGRLGRGRRGGGLAEGPDDAAGPGLRRGRRARPRGAQDRRHAHALLGLDRARRRGALPQICRHAARASAVRAARRARHDLRRRARQRVPPPPPARGGDAPRGRRLGRGTGDRVQHRRAGAALRYGDDRHHARTARARSR